MLLDLSQEFVYELAILQKLAKISKISITLLGKSGKNENEVPNICADKQRNKVTLSLLELLVAAKNEIKF